VLKKPLSGCRWGQEQVLGDFDGIHMPLIMQQLSQRDFIRSISPKNILVSGKSLLEFNFSEKNAKINNMNQSTNAFINTWQSKNMEKYPFWLKLEFFNTML